MALEVTLARALIHDMELENVEACPISTENVDKLIGPEAGRVIDQYPRRALISLRRTFTSSFSVFTHSTRTGMSFV